MNNPTARPSPMAIFNEALDFDSPSDRAVYLDGACAGDPALRARVESLLAVHNRAGDFLESPAQAPTMDVGPTELTESVGTVIGPYKLLEQIGEGGMGVVYVAEQSHPVRRKVAMKIIKPGMDTKQVVARFEAERQALAMMDHPNIAKVFDAGTTNPSPKSEIPNPKFEILNPKEEGAKPVASDFGFVASDFSPGRPYFVMELVRGIPITDYCDRDQLSIPDRLELFVLVCRAVQHAHQKGIIHRDLKPSNMLVTVIDGVAVPKVIDFGVAKATGAALTERTIYTAFHQFVGTPLYMSPEQADLSGMDMDTRSDIYSLGVLLYELLTGTTPFDQETFRQAAFDEMRRIIREDEPPKPSTRLSSLGATRATISANRKADARHLDRAIRGELDWIVMKSLEKDRRRRYETANDFAADVMRYLTDQPVEACPPSAWYRFAKFMRRNRAVVLPAAVLTFLTVAGLSIGMAVVTRERDEARLQRQRADDRFRLAFRARSKLGEVYPHLRLIAGPQATAKYQRAIEDDLFNYYRQLVENNEPDPGIGFELGDSYLRLFGLYSPTDTKQRDWAFFKALSSYERSARERPDDTRVLNALAFHCYRLARLYLGKEPERAEAAYRRALDLYEQVARTYPDHTDDWVNIYYAAHWYGPWLRSRGRSAEAEALDRRVLAWFERPEVNLNWFDTGEETHGDGFTFLSRLLVRCGQPLKAIPILERARPHVDRAYPDYLDALTNLCLTLTADADPAVRARAVALARENVEFLSRTNAQAWLILGLTLNQVGDRQASDHAFRRGIELSGDDGVELNNLAWRQVADARFSAYSPSWAVALASKATERAPRESSFWNTLGVAHYRAGEWDKAIAALEKSETLAPDKHLALNGLFLPMAHWQKGDKDKARSWFDKAVVWMNQNQSKDEELIRFRAEAEALLGKEGLDAMMPNGAAAFAR